MSALPSLPTLDQFRSTMLADGYDEMLERLWAAGTVVDTHTHPFEANAIVVKGEMWLGENGVERCLLPGDSFHLQAHVPHTERYGVEGATYWVARRS